MDLSHVLLLMIVANLVVPVLMLGLLRFISVLPPFLSSEALKDKEEPSKSNRRVCTVVHHVITASIAIASLLLDSPLLFSVALLCEAGFEASDSLFEMFNRGWTGLRGVPLYIHHTVAVSLEVIFLKNDEAIPYEYVAPLLVIIVMGGALDLSWTKIFPKFEPNAHLRMLVAGLHALMFVCSRIIAYLYYGGRLVLFAYGVSATLFMPCLVSFILFLLYHLLLLLGIVFALKNGGYLPKTERID